MEGEILEYSPEEIAEVKGSAVAWDLTQSNADSLELMVKWEAAAGATDMLVVILIVVVLAGVLLVAAGIVLTARSRS